MTVNVPIGLWDDLKRLVRDVCQYDGSEHVTRDFAVLVNGALELNERIHDAEG